MMRPSCFLAALAVGSTLSVGVGDPLPIDQPGFEQVGKWKRADTGGKAGNILHRSSASLDDLVDKVPDGGEHLAYSNDGPSHSIYQVLDSGLAPNTAYTIGIVAIDRSDLDFSPFEMRLGYVPDAEEAAKHEGAENDYFGQFLMKPAETVRPAPHNQAAADDGHRSWTTTFLTKERPGGLGRPLRIEIVGQGIQSLYDNVTLEAHALPVVVMLGDSTTDQGLPWAVKKDLDARIESLTERPAMINAGRGGDTATGALKRLEKEVLAHRPDVVTVSFGLNDTGSRDPELYGRSLRRIVRSLKGAGIKVILMTSTPFINERHFWGKEEAYQKLGGLDEYMNREFCEQVRALAKEEDLPLCDLHAVFKAEFAKNPEAIDTLLSKDGVHLTGEGLKKMSEHIVPMIEKRLADPAPEEAKLEIDDHGRLNLCAAPYFADPTGERDSTEAILLALDDVTRLTQQSFRRTLEEMEQFPAGGVHRHPDSAENRREHGAIHCSTSLDLPYLPVLYLPEGTYQVSDTLCYRHQELINTYGSEMNQQIRLRGDGVGRTVIRLIDEAPGFGKGERKPVISFMAAEQTNVATSNYCEDLTIETGRGNPGAVGLDFFANNSGAVRNVRIVSGDGSGFAGLQLGHANYSGVLLKHIEVDGFDHGLHIDSATGGMFAHAEDISVSGQGVSGVTVGAISLSLRGLRTKDVRVGLSCISPLGFTALVDSELEGRGPRGIDRQEGGLYVSKVRVVGFEDAREIDEWVHPTAFGAAGEAGMARLPVEETPIHQSAGKTRTGVRKFGARGDGVTDDSAAIQKAMNSGAAGVFFEPGRYLLNHPVVVPASVEHIDFQFCDLVAGPDLKQSDAEGFLIKG
ncbi:MAG: GDSL-type esterase/lipase family protein, partial [Haloferula sp.]